jgi:hypothetical protein
LDDSIPQGFDVHLNSPSTSPSELDPPVDPSDAASSIHTNAEREDDDTMQHLPRDEDGLVHIQQMSSFVANSAHPPAADGIAEQVNEVRRLVDQEYMVSDAQRFGDEFDPLAWIRAFPALFPYARCATIIPCLILSHSIQIYITFMRFQQRLAI